MTRYTERTIRVSGQWTKITRDNHAHTFTLARGYTNAYQAHHIETWSFKSVPTWGDAIDKATRTMITYT